MSELTWEDALEIVVAKTKHEKFRALAAEAHPHHEATRQQLLAMADPTKYTYAFHPPQTYNSELPPSKLGAADYPSRATMAVNLAKSMGSAVFGWATGKGLTVDQSEVEWRLAICFQCPKFDQAQRRCTICGCWTNLKNRLVSSHCPLPPEEGGPKW
jgi:hypothetical protein